MDRNRSQQDLKLMFMKCETCENVRMCHELLFSANALCQLGKIRRATVLLLVQPKLSVIAVLIQVSETMRC